MSKELYLQIESYIAKAGQIKHLAYFLGLFAMYRDIATMQREYENSPIFCKDAQINLIEIIQF